MPPFLDAICQGRRTQSANAFTKLTKPAVELWFPIRRFLPSQQEFHERIDPVRSLQSVTKLCERRRFSPQVCLVNVRQLVFLRDENEHVGLANLYKLSYGLKHSVKNLKRKMNR